MNDKEGLERRAAQALAATFSQLARSATLAQQLHQSRAQTLAARHAESPEGPEKLRLQERIEAHHQQGTAISTTVEHLRIRMPEVASFVRAGLAPEDMRSFGFETPDSHANED